MSRTPLPPATTQTKVIAVLRAADGGRLVPVAEVLAANGITSIEVTLGTPGALAAVPMLRAALPDTCDIGVGTVLTVDDARRSLAAGIDYVVTPNVVPSVIETLRGSGIPVVPGAMTPTEITTAWDLGATAIKVFPAAVVGVGYVRQVRAPLPHIPLIPSGGVAVAEVAQWLEAGCVAVSMGSPLVGDALEGGDLDALADRARQVRAAVDARG